MRDSKNIRLLVVEDDPVQANILVDKLLEHYKEHQIEQFISGEELKKFLENNKKDTHHYYLILDYFLQTEENSNGLNGIDIIEYLNEIHSDIQVILFSAYENDDSVKFALLPNQHENIIAVIKKSEFGFVAILNTIRFNYNKTLLKVKHKRFVVARSVLVALIALAVLFFISLYIFY